MLYQELANISMWNVRLLLNPQGSLGPWLNHLNQTDGKVYVHYYQYQIYHQYEIQILYLIIEYLFLCICKRENWYSILIINRVYGRWNIGLRYLIYDLQIVTLYIKGVKSKLIAVIFGLFLKHWYAKLKRLFLNFKPLP